ncbi:MAG: hypothetical protein JF597_47170 [Streptomyces sp.]|uniref:hypothetical protein n=1 Tax=Streptomyces sp. TaxID=1931 RepID=UPI0025E64F98|nr:hypothetical protein [Streptomyces sp.]MBW8800872.1 hypothetical protein [Streptomyces sp.]
MPSLDSSLVPVLGFIRPLSAHQAGETVHRFWFTGLSSFVKPPLCLAGIAAFQAVGQMHHGPCIAAASGLSRPGSRSCRT